MPDCMARAVDEVERPVPKVVYCWELANSESIRTVESDLLQVATPVPVRPGSANRTRNLRIVAFTDRRLRVRRVAREHGIWESASNYQVC